MSNKDIDYGDNIVRMEKYAVNKKGLFILILVIVLALGIGGYFLYKNRNNLDFDFSLPWKEKEKNEDNKDNKEEGKENGGSSEEKSEFANFTVKDKTIYEEKKLKIDFSNFKKNENDYTFDITLTSYLDKNGTISCNKILVDGYDTTSSFNFNIVKGSSLPYISTTNVSIKKSDLKESFINEFNYIKFFFEFEYEDEKNTKYQTDIYTDINVMLGNDSRKVKKKVAEKDNVVISYYKKEEDDDYHYFYFLLMGNRGNVDYNIIVKKLLINNKLEAYKDFDVLIRNNSEKIACIKIPKSSYKEINSFNISFILYEKNNKNGKMFATSQVELIK